MENDALLAPPLAAVVDRLLSRFPSEVPLDAIGEETALVTGRAEDVDAVVGAVEKAGDAFVSRFRRRPRRAARRSSRRSSRRRVRCK